MKKLLRCTSRGWKIKNLERCKLCKRTLNETDETQREYCLSCWFTLPIGPPVIIHGYRGG